MHSPAHGPMMRESCGITPENMTFLWDTGRGREREEERERERENRRGRQTVLRGKTWC